MSLHVYVKTRLTKNRVYEWKFLSSIKIGAHEILLSNLMLTKITPYLNKFNTFNIHHWYMVRGKGYEDIAET